MTVDTSDNETDRVQHQRRLVEIQRRRLARFEGAGANPASKFVHWIFVELSRKIPTKGKVILFGAIRKYLGDSSAGSVQVRTISCDPCIEGCGSN